MRSTDMAVSKIGIVGAGSMGSNMALGFAERGFKIALWDVKRENVERAKSMAKSLEEEAQRRINYFHSLDEFLTASTGDKRRVFMFSITHGNPADSVLQMMKGKLNKGDIFIDGGNEYYKTTRRRQEQLAKDGVAWLGCGVSGGYQSARHGPSMTIGGDQDACEYVLPALRTFAARASKDDQPCVARVGPDGAGHYVKMVHNGIEQGQLGALCEVVALLRSRMSWDEVGEVMNSWNGSGELKGTYLIDLSARVARTKKDGQNVVDEVLDKVVQDDDDSEGTGVWSIMETVTRHISAPTIASAHYMRVASGNRATRVNVSKKMNIMPQDQQPFGHERMQDKRVLLDTLNLALASAFLSSFCQGLELIARASKQEDWDVDLAVCIRAWRAGCIVQCDAIIDPLLRIFVEDEDRPVRNLKMVAEISDKLRETLPALKHTVLAAIEQDYNVPTLSATLEYVKYIGSDRLVPAQFQESLLDAFGAHGYDRWNVKGEDPGKTKKGAQHYEWMPT